MVADRLRGARRVTLLTGAGVSAASGIPTFRGAGGLWRQFRPEQLATAAAFANDPRLVWEWYDWRRAKIADALPNAAHEVIARWTANRPGTTLITQNVDGLHERAGSAHTIRLHGSIWELRCWNGCRESGDRWRDERVPLPDLPPKCPHCGALARPGVVWFGESLHPAVLDDALAACECDVFVAAGTSAVVYPAAGLIEEAKRRGAFTVEINPDATDASARVDAAIVGLAEEILPALEHALGRTSERR
jgi:NAD-dependent deacetylase